MTQQSLPQGWQWLKLSQVVEIIMGQSPPSSSYNDRSIGLPFFQGKMEFGDLYPIPQKWCSQPGKIAEPNDILISVRAPVGPTNLASQLCCIGRGLAALRAKRNLHYLFLLYYLRANESMLAKHGQPGSTFNAITKEQLENVEIPLPPIPIQRAIITILNKARSVYDKHEAAHGLTMQVGNALFIEILGHPATNPKEWPEIPLGTILNSVRRPMHTNAEDNYKQVTIRWYGKGAMVRKHGLGSERKTDRQYLVEKGDFIYSRIDARKGAFAIAGEDIDGCIVTSDFPIFKINRHGSKKSRSCLTMFA